MTTNDDLPSIIQFEIAYIPAIEGPVQIAARLITRDQRTAIPNESAIKQRIESAYVNGYILRGRYDDHQRRLTRLTFKRRARYPHQPDADFLST